jgi:hypothetical protein
LPRQRRMRAEAARLRLSIVSGRLRLSIIGARLLLGIVEPPPVSYPEGLA